MTSDAAEAHPRTSIRKIAKKVRRRHRSHRGRICTTIYLQHLPHHDSIRVTMFRLLCFVPSHHTHAGVTGSAILYYLLLQCTLSALHCYFILHEYVFLALLVFT